MILTGTPDGLVGGRYGDEVVTEIDGIGSLSTPSSVNRRSAMRPASPLNESEPEAWLRFAVDQSLGAVLKS